MNELLSVKYLNLGLAWWIAKQIETEYDYALSYFYDALEHNFMGDVIRVINNTRNLLCSRAKIFIDMIEDMKKNGKKVQEIERNRADN